MAKRQGERGNGRRSRRTVRGEGAKRARETGPRQARGSHGGGQRRQPAVPHGYIEGRRAAAEALESGVALRRALVAPGGGHDASFDALVARLESAGVPVEVVPRERLDALSAHGAHQGVVLEAKPFSYASLEDIVGRAGEGDALVVALDHVTDEGNLGAIVRTAEVVGAAGVIIPKARSASVGTAAYKTSAGAVLHLPIAQVSNLSAALDELKGSGFWVAGATEHAELDVWHAPLEGRLCLVMGSEGEGLSQLVQRRCDFLCRLPQRGVVESLNVAQATTVLCYEWLRRLLASSTDGADAPGVAAYPRDGKA